MTDTVTASTPPAPAEPLVDPIMEAPAPAITPAVDPVEEPVEAEPRNSPADQMKAKIRGVLAAQPFRGHAVHKDDLIAVIDALIDGPEDGEWNKLIILPHDAAAEPVA